MRRKLFSLLLSIAMVMVMMPSMVFATDGTVGGTGTSGTGVGEGTGETTYVAEIGETQYKTLTDAISAAKNNDTIILNDDTTESVTIPKDKTLTINLGEHTITNADNQDTITIANGATLTILSSGTVDNVSHGRAAIYNNGTAILQGGNYTRSKENGVNASTSGGNSYYNILNHGELTIENGVTVKQDGHFSSLIDNGYYEYGAKQNPRSGYVEGTNNPYPTMTINGGTFDGGLNTIKNDDGGKLVINDGVFKDYTQNVVQNHNIAEINGGTFTGAGTTKANIYNCGCAADIDVGQLTIRGGIFTGGSEAVANNPNHIEESFIKITGGTFSSDPTAYVAKDVKDLYIYKPSDKEFIVGGAGIGLEKHSCKDGNSYFELGETDTAIFSPKGVDACITWHSKDENVVKIDEKKGTLETVGTGVADIYVKAVVDKVSSPASEGKFNFPEYCLTIHVSAPYIPSTPSVAPTTKTEVSTETKPNGDKVTTTTTTNTKTGDVTEKVETTKTDGSKETVVKETTTNEFGNKVTEATQTNTSAAGETTVTNTTTIDTQQVGPITVNVEKDADGKVTNAAAQYTTTGKDVSGGVQVYLNGNHVKQIAGALGDDTQSVTITTTVKTNSGKDSFTISANAKDLKAGNELYIVAVDEDGNETLVDAKTYETTAAGSIRAVLDDGANYKLITKEEKDALVKEIKASIAPKTTKKSVTAGKTSKMTLKDTLDKDNVKSITYKTSKRSVATVSKNGTIIGKKAGKATISAVVTLKDGSKKTVRMTVTVKAKKYNK